MTPALSIQLYAEPFVSAGDYSNFEESSLNGRSKSLRGTLQAGRVAGNPDFNYRSFRTTNVMRWELKPGSALFVVWQQGRERDHRSPALRFQSRLGGIFDAPARNMFLIKWSYWINP